MRLPQCQINRLIDPRNKLGNAAFVGGFRTSALGNASRYPPGQLLGKLFRNESELDQSTIQENDMSFRMKTVPELVQIASAGGGFRLDAAMRTTPELVQIASAASRSGARVTFVGINMRTTPELVQIASAGKGCVFFEDGAA